MKTTNFSSKFSSRLITILIIICFFYSVSKLNTEFKIFNDFSIFLNKTSNNESVISIESVDKNKTLLQLKQCESIFHTFSNNNTCEVKKIITIDKTTLFKVNQNFLIDVTNNFTKIYKNYLNITNKLIIYNLNNNKIVNLKSIINDFKKNNDIFFKLFLIIYCF